MTYNGYIFPKNWKSNRQIEHERIMAERQAETLCCCFEVMGDNPNCQIHNQPEGSDTSIAAQLTGAGFYESGVL